jgi:hypothetical protein
LSDDESRPEAPRTALAGLPALAALPRPVLRAAVRAWPPPPRARIERLTGLAEDEWRALGRLFPLLGADPGLAAARARRDFALLARYEVSRSRPRPFWDPAPPPGAPQLLVTAHLGGLRMLRYLLRSSGIPTATIIDETHLGSRKWRPFDEWIERRFPVGLPHTFSAREPHRLRSALRRGSLLAAIDRIHRPPPGADDRSARVPFLGGSLEIELAPLRLARLAGVAVRPIFATAPDARLTITVGDALPEEDAGAARAFGELLDRTARRSPGDFDGFTHRYLAR